SSSQGIGLSGDGFVVVGYSYIDPNDGHAHAFRWTASTGMTDLGSLPLGPGQFARVVASGVNADGSVIVGVNDTVTPSFGMWVTETEAFRWTASSGMVGLGFLSSFEYSSAAATNADGSVVVGASIADGGFRAFRWTASDGMVNLGILPGYVDASAEDVSADGSVVVGSAVHIVNNIGSSQAFLWTASTGMVGLGFLPGDDLSNANGISGDGSVVVGISGDLPGPAGDLAFLWDQVFGMQDLRQVLVTQYGLNNLGGWVLSQ